MTKKIKKLYLQKKKRTLKKIFGTFERPRLCVVRSHQHIYAQLIDDQNHKTLVCSSTLEKTIKSQCSKVATKEASYLVGEELAKKATLKEINLVAFDRGTRPYLGRIQALAEGARNGGLCF